MTCQRSYGSYQRSRIIKKAKSIDFYTTGRQPLEQDFARVSEWIKKDKQKQHPLKQTKYTTATGGISGMTWRLCTLI